MKIRAIEVVRATWGVALLVAPRSVLTRVHHLTVDRRAVLIARILGARHLTQASLSGANPSPEVLATGVWVDTVHSLTAVGLAVVDRSRARAGLTDAVIAAVWAAFGWRDLHTGRVPRRSHEHRRDQLARIVLPRLPGGQPLAQEAERRRSAA